MEKNIFDKYLSKTKNFLYFSILVFVIGIALFGYSFYTKYNEKNTARNIQEISMNDDAKEEELAYIETTKTAYKLGSLGSTDGQYYIIANPDNYWFIVHLTEKEFQNLANDLKENKTAKIYGAVKEFNNTIKNKVITAYNKDFEEQITRNDFASYFGYYYLNTSSSSSISTINIWSYTILGLGAILILVYYFRFANIHKRIKNFDDSEWETIKREANEQPISTFNKNKIILTDTYFIYLGAQLIILKYDEIAWAYQFEQYVNGVPSSLSIIIYNINKKHFSIAKGGINKKQKEEIMKIFEIMHSKNEKIILGYNADTTALAKEMYDIK